MVADARTAFPHLSSRTIQLADNHFHCPSASDILTVMASFAAIERKIPLLDVRCVSASSSSCRIVPTSRHIGRGDLLEICPPSSYELNDLAGDSFGGQGSTRVWTHAVVGRSYVNMISLSRRALWRSKPTPTEPSRSSTPAIRSFNLEPFRAHRTAQVDTWLCLRVRSIPWKFVP